jgi:hypothetical protein
MADDFSTHESSLNSPASNAATVTPSTSPLSYTTRGLWVGGAGDVNVTMAGGGNVVFSGVPAGTLLPIRVTHVLATSTTATLIDALW